MNNQIRNFIWDIINLAAVEVKACMNNYVLIFYVDEITYTCPNHDIIDLQWKCKMGSISCSPISKTGILKYVTML